nr:aminotransferase class I/II-fold pyridoxal phosphate-dependent enzyme [Parapedobacter soli]
MITAMNTPGIAEHSAYFPRFSRISIDSRQDPQRTGQVTELRRKHGAHQGSRSGNRRKVVAEKHIAVRGNVVAPVGQRYRRSSVDRIKPHWRMKLWKNIRHLTDGLRELGLDIGATESAIIPVKIGDIAKTLEAGKLLLRAGIFANPIMYPAVAKKDARIRLNVMATHTTEQLDKVLEAFSDVKRRLNS